MLLVDSFGLIITIIIILITVKIQSVSCGLCVDVDG